MPMRLSVLLERLIAVFCGGDDPTATYSLLIEKRFTQDAVLPLGSCVTLNGALTHVLVH